MLRAGADRTGAVVHSAVAARGRPWLPPAASSDAPFLFNHSFLVWCAISVYTPDL